MTEIRRRIRFGAGVQAAPPESKVEIVRARRDLFNRNVAALVRRLKAGRITPSEFEDRMAEEIKDLWTTSYVAGKGADWSEMEFADYGSVGGRLRRQYSFLRGFRQDLEQEGVESFSRAKLEDRARLYGEASSVAFETGRAAQQGIPPGVLPAMPGDGSTICKARDRCFWQIETINAERRQFEATWTLRPAEHCRTCRQRASAWVNLEIDGGVLVSSPDPIFD